MNFGLFTSITIGGLLLLTIFALQERYMQNSIDLTMDETTMQDVHTLQEIINYDFKKIGYDRTRKINSAITLADSNRIDFKANLDNTGPVENVEWNFSNDQVLSSENPFDHVLTRDENGVKTTFNSAVVVKFHITYYQKGSDTPMAFPITGSSLNEIRRIKVELICESMVPSIGDNANQKPHYIPSTWQEVFTPLNLN